jgi:multisubunit Na+/H+ antiporter MnhG subunit
MRDAVVAVLLVAGVALAVFATAGVVLMRSAMDRLHNVGVEMGAFACIAAAVFVRDSFSLSGNKALALAAFVLVTSPVVTHVTARAIWKQR